MITWGSTTLSVFVGSWCPSRGKSVIEEIELLPNPADLSAVCSVLQQAGKTRRRVKGRLILTSVTNYNTLLGDMEEGTSRTLADGDTINGSYLVDDLGELKDSSAGLIMADITFVEA